jgi:hypothetical protein
VSSFHAFVACIGSPCLRHCVHGASIGGGSGPGGLPHNDGLRALGGRAGIGSEAGQRLPLRLPTYATFTAVGDDVVGGEEGEGEGTEAGRYPLDSAEKAAAWVAGHQQHDGMKRQRQRRLEEEQEGLVRERREVAQRRQKLSFEREQHRARAEALAARCAHVTTAAAAAAARQASANSGMAPFMPRSNAFS